ncbi:hypothetical protein RJZ56_000417 [Blastomyces dermatitidis]|uniref:Uncharacterized protein n=2 Tax=Ajellomyces dermatitidis TaxID=5039 RepID=F2T2A2_AJEDA|nr:uncharacterized protein BDCG_03375 [Blastomyces dermatitidis ER-3]XP_045280418.1 hypothetical protein, variant [Blastomyces dermatitidis ER-3]EGE77586.1 hypothetical protein BDDG_00523 [Blastomyces dermatitidis ATCC 18188]EQL33674.1 hypothetical protein BDFG_04412 [Blastomyces dermatitidis ATCC 26199]EEQ88255.1 hypothetical protein BDCG_03375 [Blastomyces dermatitidis ER-3]EQL33675.1 hypothetical protein, variant [Blastomyces dermatitidis ATCC 26199]OAT00691.1 hypothetical protein, variant
MEPQEEVLEDSVAPKYRRAKPLPFELSRHCNIYFEEKLYHQALHLLLSLLSSGTIASGPAFVPTTQQLAVAATLVVHPSTTTLAKSREAAHASTTALQLLRLTNKLVGPLAAQFGSAFAFTRYASSRHRGSRRKNDGSEGAGAPGMDSYPGLINMDIARRGSIWFQSEDFWSAVGWAFNCAVLYPKRWSRWRVWLEFMCDVLEDDWAEREKLIDSSKNGVGALSSDDTLRQSLIFKYISGTSGVSSQHRRIVRAIFADGNQASLNEFKMIFRNELKEPEKDKDHLKRREADVNVDEGIFGDYLARDEDDVDEENDAVYTGDTRPSRPKRSRTTAPTPFSRSAENLDMHPSYKSSSITHSGQETLLGDVSAIGLRQRLMQILSRVSDALPEDYMTVEDLYQLFGEFVRPLSLPTFQLLVSCPMLSNFADNARTTLCKTILSLLLHQHPNSEQTYINQSTLEKYYLPFAANTNDAIENAKVSILLETLLLLLASNDMLQVQPSLRAAIQKGIIARADKAQSDAKKSQDKRKLDEIGWAWLIESGERITYLVDKLLSSEMEGQTDTE